MSSKQPNSAASYHQACPSDFLSNQYMYSTFQNPSSVTTGMKVMYVMQPCIQWTADSGTYTINPWCCPVHVSCRLSTSMERIQTNKVTGDSLIPFLFSWQLDNYSHFSTKWTISTNYQHKWKKHTIKNTKTFCFGPSKDTRLIPLAHSFFSKRCDSESLEHSSIPRTIVQPSHLMRVQRHCFHWKGVVWWTWPNCQWVLFSCCWNWD